jgi:hypothetical protein
MQLWDVEIDKDLTVAYSDYRTVGTIPIEKNTMNTGDMDYTQFNDGGMAHVTSPHIPQLCPDGAQPPLPAVATLRLK